MISLSTEELIVEEDSEIKVYPNPAEESVRIDLGLENASRVSLYIYDYAGKLVEKLVDKQTFSSAESEVTWNSSLAEAGVYYYSALVDGVPYSGPIIIR